MATANFFAGFDDQVEQQNIERQRQYAQALRKQSQEPMAQGQMVGKHYVAPSFTQGLAKMLQSYYAGQGESQADDQQKALAEAVRGRNSEEFGKFTGMLSGTPAREIQPLTPNDDDGNVNPTIKMDAQAPDLAGAYKYAATAHNPKLQEFGLNGALTQAQDQAKQAQAKALQAQQLQMWQQSENNPQKFMQLGGDPKIAKEMAESTNWGKEKGVVINGQLVNPLTAAPMGNAVPKQADVPNMATDLLVPDPNNPGKMIPNSQLIGVKSRLAQDGKTVVTQSVNTGQKGFDNTLKLRGDFRSEPIYKAHQEMTSAHSQIGASLKASSPVGDLAAATKIMKLLDPGSVVRESELGMAVAASGLADRIGSYASNVISGEKLTPQQRKDFQALADQLFTESVNQYNGKRTEYSQIAGRNELNIDDVVGTASKAPTPATPVAVPANRPPLSSFKK